MIERIIQYTAALAISTAASYTLGVYHAENTKPPEVSPVPIEKVEVHNLEYNGPYSSLSEVNSNDEQRRCLALNIYHEAKNQSDRGKRAVALVTLNRVMSDRYPDTICGVVKQGRYDNGKFELHKCQFSWFCNGVSDKPTHEKSWKKSLDIANMIIDNSSNQHDYTDGSLWYHADYVSPEWSKRLNKTVKIQDHIFYNKEN